MWQCNENADLAENSAKVCSQLPRECFLWLIIFLKIFKQFASDISEIKRVIIYYDTLYGSNLSISVCRYTPNLSPLQWFTLARLRASSFRSERPENLQTFRAETVTWLLKWKKLLHLHVNMTTIRKQTPIPLSPPKKRKIGQFFVYGGSILA